MAKSARGKEVNFAGLRTTNQYMPAIGNAKMNARGDKLGKGGKIIKKREEIVNEYNTKVKNAAITVPVSEDLTRSKRTEEPKAQSDKQKADQKQVKKSTKQEEV